MTTTTSVSNALNRNCRANKTDIGLTTVWASSGSFEQRSRNSSVDKNHDIKGLIPLKASAIGTELADSRIHGNNDDEQFVVCRRRSQRENSGIHHKSVASIFYYFIMCFLTLPPYTPWVKKTRHQTLGHKFTNYYPIFKIFSLADLAVNLQQIDV